MRPRRGVPGPRGAAVLEQYGHVDCAVRGPAEFPHPEFTHTDDFSYPSGTVVVWNGPEIFMQHVLTAEEERKRGTPLPPFAQYPGGRSEKSERGVLALKRSTQHSR